MKSRPRATGMPMSKTAPHVSRRNARLEESRGVSRLVLSSMLAYQFMTIKKLQLWFRVGISWLILEFQYKVSFFLFRFLNKIPLCSLLLLFLVKKNDLDGWKNA